jgi:hypothetical protein
VEGNHFNAKSSKSLQSLQWVGAIIIKIFKIFMILNYYNTNLMECIILKFINYNYVKLKCYKELLITKTPFIILNYTLFDREIISCLIINVRAIFSIDLSCYLKQLKSIIKLNFTGIY